MIGGVCLLYKLHTIIGRIRYQHDTTTAFPHIGCVARETLCRVAFHLTFLGTEVKRLLTQTVLYFAADIYEMIRTGIIIH